MKTFKEHLEEQIKTIKVGEDAIGTNKPVHYAVVKERKVLATGTKEEMISYCEKRGGRVWKTSSNVGDLVESKELEEIFGSIPFVINTLKWSSKHKGQKPKGKDTWKFDYILPVQTSGQGFLDDGEFSFKGLFKKAVQALVKYLKTRAKGGGNIKQAKVTLKP